MNPDHADDTSAVSDGRVGENTVQNGTVRQGDSRLRLALEAGGLGTWHFDFRAGIGTASARTWKMFGLPERETVPIEEWTNRIHPEDREAARLEFQRAATSGVFRMDCRVMRPDGDLRWVAVTGSLEHGQDGTPISLDGVIEDITERKRTEQALMESQARLVATLEQLPAGVGLMDTEGHWVLRNTLLKSFVEDTIPSRDPDVKKRWRSWDAEGRPLEPSRWPGARALRGETVSPGLDMLYTHPDGRNIWTRVSAVPFRDPAGQITGAIAVIQDITERKRAEEILLESQERQAYLLKLSDALRPLVDPNAIQEVAARTLGAHLGASRVFYGEMIDDHNLMVERNYVSEGQRVLSGRFRVNDFGAALVAALTAGRTISLPEIARAPELSAAEREAYAALGIAALTGVPLVKGGRFVANLAVHQSAPRAWTPAEVRLIEETAERTWAAVERARAEEQLRRSEQMSSALVENAPFGVYLIDAQFRLRTINEGSRKVFSGIEPLFGRDFAEVLRIVWQEPFASEAIGRFRHTLATGEPFISPPIVEQRANTEEIESYDWQIHRIVLPDGSFGVVCYFYDLSKQKRLEAAVRRAAEFDAFRVRLSDALRPLSDANDIQTTVTRIVLDSFGADRCYYCEIEDDQAIIRRDAAREGLPSVVGAYPLGGMPVFRAVIEAGRSFVVDDANTTDVLDEELRQLCLQLRIVSFIDVPVIKNARPVGILCITQAAPRAWTGLEVALAEETAERTWAAVERARAEAALRDREARLDLALEAAELGTFVWHVTEDRSEPDARARVHFGLPPDSTVSLEEALVTTFHPDDGPRYAAAVARATDPAGPGRLHEEFRVRHPDGQERWMAVSAITAFEGTPRVAVRLTGVLADITERKRAEETLSGSADRQTFLLKLSDTLRAQIGVEAVGNRATQMIAEKLGADRVYLVTLNPGDDNILVTHESRREDMPPLRGAYRGSDFPSAMKEIFERTIVYTDVRSDARLSDQERLAFAGLGAVGFMAAPIRRGDDAMIWAAGAVSTKPRAWTPSEIALFEDAVERTWAAVERARAEEALRESEARMQRALAIETVGVIFFKADGSITGCNDAFLRMSGYSREDLEQNLLRWDEMTPPEFMPQSLQAVKEFEQFGRTTPYEKQYIRKDGSRWWALFAATRISAEEGVEFILDISQRREAESTRAWLAAIVEYSSDAIISFDLSGMILSWNPGAAAMFGHRAEEAVGQGIGLLAPDDRQGEGLANLERLRRGESVIQRDTEGQRKGGSRFDALVTASPIRDETGRVIAATAVIQDVTERKRTQRALTEAERRYREFVSQVRDHAIFSINPQGVITTWNEGCRAVLGFEEAEFIGLDVGMLFTPQDRAAGAHRAELERAAREGIASDDRWMQRRDGTRFFASGATSAVRAPDETLEGFTKVMRDITERHRAETALLESEERLKLALESGQMGAWDWDMTSGVQHWSPEMSAIFGVEHLPIRLVTDFFGMVHPDDLSRIRARASEAAAEGLDFVDDEFRIRRPDGTERWVASRSRFQRGANGTPARMAGVNLDITERKQAADALQESQERFRLLAEHTSDVYWLTDYPARKPLYISPAYRTILGLPADAQLELDGWVRAIHPDDRERVAQAFAQKALEGAFDEEYRIVRADGGLRWIRDRAFPIRDASGAVSRIAGVAQDITERRLIEDRLREINERQRRFVADAAHELRAPLMAMSGNLELLLAQPPADPDRLEMIHDLHHETERLSALVNDLLTVARGDSGAPMQREPVRLECVLLDAWRLAMALPDGHRMELGRLEPCLVMGDANRLKQLALILLENAVKYTPKGGSIRLELRHHPDHAEFRVSDTGPGIPTADLERVFERFYRGDKARTRGPDPGGTGLGLPIARLIIEHHGGRIWLESAVGHGTVAVVQLPCMSEQPDDHPDP